MSANECHVTRNPNAAAPSRAATLCAFAVAFAQLAPAGAASQRERISLDPPTPLSYFGSTLAIDGNTAAMAAPVGDNGPGPARIQVRELVDGRWELRSTLIGGTGEAFGTALALDGGVLAARVSRGDRHWVHVFNRSDDAWSLQAVLPTPLGEPYDQFGRSIAVDGDTLLVGAPNAGGGSTDPGVIYAYQRTGSAWTLAQLLTTPTPQLRGHLGAQLALDGDTLVTSGAEASFHSYAERVHVFERSNGTWAHAAELMPPVVFPPGEQGSFGASIAVEGNTAFVGDPNVRHGDRVHVYLRSTQGWSHDSDLTPFGDDEDFGRAIAATSSRVVVGAPRGEIVSDAGTSYVNTGSVYAFARGEAGWTPVDKLTPFPGTRESHFGSAVAINQTNVLVGAPYEDDVPILGPVRVENRTVEAPQNTGAVYSFAHIGCGAGASTAMTLAYGTQPDLEPRLAQAC
jgi:hypothetical protein